MTYTPGQTEAMTAVQTAFDVDNAAAVGLQNAWDQAAEASQAKYDELKRAYDAYVASHPDTPPPTERKTLFGISVNDTKLEGEGTPGDVHRIEAFTSQDAVQAVRVFYGGSLVSKFTLDAALTNSYANGVRLFHTSWKTALTQAIASSYAASLPTDVRNLWTEHHEVEDNIEAGDLTFAQWQAQQKSAAAIVAGVGGEFWLTLMGWTLNPASKRDPENYWVEGAHKGVSFDVYNKDMEVVIPKCVAFAKKHGVPWGISETGASATVKGTVQTSAERVAWAKKTRALILALPEADRPQFILWWDVKQGSFDNTLTETIADTFFGTV